jgi:hypothetical protein
VGLAIRADDHEKGEFRWQRCPCFSPVLGSPRLITHPWVVCLLQLRCINYQRRIYRAKWRCFSSKPFRSLCIAHGCLCLCFWPSRKNLYQIAISLANSQVRTRLRARSAARILFVQSARRQAVPSPCLLAVCFQDCDRSFVMDIYQMYGDHLYR